jgi:SAM-dependent methyltransferase
VTPCLLGRDGRRRPLEVDRWTAPASPSELELLADVDGPVLDLGCGPGRLVAALAEAGTPAMGVDASPAAIESAIERGASALCRSLFDALPGEGRWRTVLLLDGNIGIGGHPARLLARARSLACAGGSILVEVDPPGHPTRRTEARLEGAADAGPWFPWAWVSADGLGAYAAEAGLVVRHWHRPEGRWVGHLVAEPVP